MRAISMLDTAAIQQELQTQKLTSGWSSQLAEGGHQQLNTLCLKQWSRMHAPGVSVKYVNS